MLTMKAGETFGLDRNVLADAAGGPVHSVAVVCGARLMRGAVKRRRHVMLQGVGLRAAGVRETCARSHS